MFIIFTIGRTGSTLLINILNKFEGVTFSGEIYNIELLRKMNNINNIMRIEDFTILQNNSNLMRGTKSNHVNYFPRNTNYYKYFHKVDQFLCNYNRQTTIKDRLKFIMPLDKISGCKILTNSKVVKDFFLNYKISKEFKVILLIRENVDRLRDSMKRAGFGSYRRVNLEKENLEYKKLSDKENTYLLTYEDILKQNSRFNGLFDFIGIKNDRSKVIKGMNEICSYASSNR